ncbi:MAG: DUF2065 domain-containing protein [Proteobacteria bacterium]|nr:DUF2065 domain-containing protein [Pseudomonadota bacterium]RTL00890.1 MAG: DUF2065 domain-containing protein [Xanthomonadales bacterium]
MMWHDLLSAFGLMLVMEGVVPFLSPQALRTALVRLASLSDRELRVGAALSMALGVAVLYWIR